MEAEAEVAAALALALPLEDFAMKDGAGAALGMAGKTTGGAAFGAAVGAAVGAAAGWDGWTLVIVGAVQVCSRRGGREIARRGGPEIGEADQIPAHVGVRLAKWQSGGGDAGLHDAWGRCLVRVGGAGALCICSMCARLGSSALRS